jgi:hypothetical protein
LAIFTAALGAAKSFLLRVPALLLLLTIAAAAVGAAPLMVRASAVCCTAIKARQRLIAITKDDVLRAKAMLSLR